MQVFHSVLFIIIIHLLLLHNIHTTVSDATVLLLCLQAPGGNRQSVTLSDSGCLPNRVHRKHWLQIGHARSELTRVGAQACLHPCVPQVCKQHVCAGCGVFFHNCAPAVLSVEVALVLWI